MKINYLNSLALVNHLRCLDSMLKNSPGPYPFGVYNQLTRLEKRAHRLTEIGCNRELTEKETEQLSKIETKVKSLFKDCYYKQIFINYDCRGYALKIRSIKPENIESEFPGLNFDWGRYGILAPKF